MTDLAARPPVAEDLVEEADEADDPERALAGAQVVDRVVDILEAFVWLGPQLGVSEISRALDLKKATAHRLLASLRRRGLVAQDPITRRYRLGMKLWELGSRATTQVEWLERAKPLLEELCTETGETCHIAVLADGEALYVEKVESTRSLRMPSQVGRRLPVHCTGVGKALAAFLPEDVLAGIVRRGGLRSFTPRTITDLGSLREALAAIRERGYATDDEEIEAGLTCVAAPIRDHTGHVVAAVSAAGPTPRMRDGSAFQHVQPVVGTAHKISRALGCPPEYLHVAIPAGG